MNGPSTRPQRREVLGIDDAPSRLPALVERAMSGEDIVIARYGLPLARLVPMTRTKREPPAELRGGPLPGNMLDPMSDREPEEWEGR